ncbi:DEAD/DEAH box helicase, partial [Vibrio parahaemolyticus]
MTEKNNKQESTSPVVSSLPRRPQPPKPRTVLELSQGSDLARYLCDAAAVGEKPAPQAPESYWPDKSAESIQEKLNEADTCRKYVTPKLVDAGWDNAPHQI